jgi:periplasmic iron binding protein
LAAAIFAAPRAAAKEDYFGEPIMQNDMQIVPHSLLGVEMAPMPKGASMGRNVVHVGVGVHATKDVKHGFKKDEWIPYLTTS